MSNEYLGKAPELLAMLLLVSMFLKAMAGREKAAKDRDALFIAAIQQISAQHIEARDQSRKVIEENSVHTKRATEAMIIMNENLRNFPMFHRKPFGLGQTGFKIDSPSSQG